MKKNLFGLVIIVLIIVLMLIYPQYITAGAASGLSYSIGVLIPSLFPFMVLSSYALPIFNRIFKGRFQRIFIFCMSLFGGYPVGAACLKNGKVEEKIAEYLLYTCVNPSPAFLISVVGQGLLGNQKLGFILAGAVYAASALLFTAGLLFSGKNKAVKAEEYPRIDFVEAVAEAGKSVFTMSLMVTIFCSVGNLLYQLGVPHFLGAMFEKLHLEIWMGISILPGILEVMSGMREAVLQGSSLAFLAFLAAFGGFSVHFQIFSVASGISFSKIKFIFFRIVHGALAYIFARLLLSVVPISLIVFSTNHEKPSVDMGSTVPGTIALIFLISLLLLSLKKCRFVNDERSRIEKNN